MSKIEAAVNWTVGIAQDDSHGYDQADRWGEYGDYDCSSLLISAWQSAGVPVKDSGATYTANMYNAFLKCGFEDVSEQVNLATGDGLQRGDVLLNHVEHTSMYIGDNRIVEAQYSETQSAFGYAGDQTGKEIWVRNYYNFPWNCVLRYCGDNTIPSSVNGKINVCHQVCTEGIGWNAEVINWNDVDVNGYSGIIGKAAVAFRACSVGDDASVCGCLTYRAHELNGDWYKWRTDYNLDNAKETYAGDGVNQIDGLQMTIEGVSGKKAKYRVHTINHGWLGWIEEYGDGNNGYAGLYGDPIDAVQVEII